MELIRELPYLYQVQFTKCVTHQDMITFILDHDAIEPYLKKYKGYTPTPTKAKDSVKCKELRICGNDYYKKNQMAQALHSYTESIFQAASSDELALAFANRSAVFIDMNHSQECCDDVNRALLCGYPAEKAFKLHVRKGKCYIKLEMPNLAHQSFREALKTLKDSDVDEKTAAETEAMIKDHLEKLQQLNGSTKMKKRNDKLPSLFKGKNVKFENASHALQIAHSTKKGRYVEAKNFIPNESVLLVEKPFASKLLPEFYKKRCFHCYSQTLAPLPCYGCSQIMFCSGICRDASWNKFHKFECQYLDFLNEMETQHLALRILLTAGLEAVVDMKLKLDENNLPSRIIGLNESDEYKQSYYSIYHLQQASLTEETRDQIVTKVITTCQLIWFMESRLIDAFDEDETDTAKRFIAWNAIARSPIYTDQSFIANLIFRHCQQLICNQVSVTIPKAADASFVSATPPVEIATAVYASASIMNHSCIPNTISNFQNGTLVVTAAVDIDPGQEISTCYNACHHLVKTRNERHTVLKNVYNFVCTCWACVNGDGDGIPFRTGEITLTLACRYCAGPVKVTQMYDGNCGLCNRHQNCADSMQKYSTSNVHFANGERLQILNFWKAALKEFEICLNLRKLCVYRNNMIFACVYAKIATGHKVLGNYKEAYENLLAYMAIVKQTFGPNTVEYTDALDRLTDLIFRLIEQTRDAEQIKSYVNVGIEACSSGLELLQRTRGNDHPTCKKFTERMNLFQMMNLKI